MQSDFESREEEEEEEEKEGGGGVKEEGMRIENVYRIRKAELGTELGGRLEGPTGHTHTPGPPHVTRGMLKAI